MSGRVESPIVAAMRSIGAVGKTGWNAHYKYHYRRAEDVLAAVQPVFADLGLWPRFEITEHSITQAGKMFHAVLRIRLTVIGPGGDPVASIDAIGEGMDTGDKATNKAMTAAVKLALTYLFLIPTDASVDSEVDSPEPTKVKRRNSKPKKEKPGQAPAKPSEEARKLAEVIRGAETAGRLAGLQIEAAMFSGREREWLQKLIAVKNEQLTGEIAS